MTIVVGNNQYYTLGEVASQAQRSPATVRKWLKEKKLDSEIGRQQPSSNRWIFTENELKIIVKFSLGVSE